MISSMGEQGFRWFFGLVEDRDDPKKMGRVRVRVYGVHPFTQEGTPDISKVPKEDLPWAIPLNSIINAGIKAVNNIQDNVGLSPLGLMVGSTVFGFFVDGNECQMPMIMGSLSGLVGSDEYNEIPRTSQGFNSVFNFKEQNKVLPNGPFPGEPSTTYDPTYPYNKSLRTESGHLIEIDDTPGKERLHFFHKSGTYNEIDASGNKTIKVKGNKFDVTVKNNNVYVGGDVNIYVQGNAITTINGDCIMNVNGNSTKNVNGDYTLISNGTITLIGKQKIDLNP